MGTQYLYALFWSTNYNLGVGGEPEKPTDNFERVVALFICLVRAACRMDCLAWNASRARAFACAAL